MILVLVNYDNFEPIRKRKENEEEKKEKMKKKRRRKEGEQLIEVN